METPEQVRRALAFLWLSFTIAVVETFIGEFFETGDYVVWAIYIAIYAIWAAVIFAISKRKNWARVFALGFVALSFTAFIAWQEMRTGPWWDYLSLGVWAVLDGTALYWLFTGDGRAWFRVRA